MGYYERNNRDTSLVFRGGGKITNMGSNDLNNQPSFELQDVSCTLLARDFKGLSNYGSNGVLEIYEVREHSNER